MEEDENKTEVETSQSKRTEETHPNPQSSSPEVDSIVSKEPTKEAMTKATEQLLVGGGRGRRPGRSVFTKHQRIFPWFSSGNTVQILQPHETAGNPAE